MSDFTQGSSPSGDSPTLEQLNSDLQRQLAVAKTQNSVLRDQRNAQSDACASLATESRMLSVERDQYKANVENQLQDIAQLKRQNAELKNSVLGAQVQNLNLVTILTAFKRGHIEDADKLFEIVDIDEESNKLVKMNDKKVAELAARPFVTKKPAAPTTKR
jgi:septal ring factor EnvC (AmiA/AmiB activator)